jgi:hypothetical protein
MSNGAAEPSPTIVYVLSRGHSGSTLLNLLVGSHSEVAGVGELKVLSPTQQSARERFRVKPCTCGVAPMRDCAFWREVDERVERRTGLRLHELDVLSRDPATFREHNLALFGAVSAASGRRFVVDSSKSAVRLAALRAAGVFDVRAVHLVRSPLGVVYSNVKKGRNWLSHTFSYSRGLARERITLAGTEYYPIRYESLAREPRRTIADLMSWLGLAFEEEQMNWTAREHHHVAGNHMRFAKGTEIRLDEAWKRGLTPVQKAAILSIAAPVRLLTPGLVRAVKPVYRVMAPRA